MVKVPRLVGNFVRFWVTLSVFAASTAFGDMAARAQGLDATPDPFAINVSIPKDVSTIFVDLVAAEFFEERLRLSQSRRIEAETAREYLTLSPEARARFRAERKKQWAGMSTEERAVLRGVKLPSFGNLTEQQKRPFRQIALRELGVIAPHAPEAGDRGEI